MKNRRAFTLIELLAVIVILAIILAIALPRVTHYITNTRKNSFITTTKDFVDAIRKDATGEIYELPIAKNDVTVVSINMVGLEKGGIKSSYNGRWIHKNSYVAIVNVGTDIDPIYNYYVAIADSKRYIIPLTLDEKVSTSTIYRYGSSDPKSSITSLCGNVDGKYMLIPEILGLEATSSTGWNATVYSNGGC